MATLTALHPDATAKPRLRERLPGGATPGGEGEDPVDLRRILRAVWRRKAIVLLVTVAMAMLFHAVTALQEDRFTASAAVLLDAREQRVIAAQDQVVADLELNNPILESEVTLLRSSSLLEAAIRDLGMARFASPDAPEDAPAVADRDAEEAGRRQLNRIVALVRRGLSVQRLGESHAIQISVETTDPVLSADLADALARVYISGQLADRQRVAETATAWLSGQVEARRIDVEAAEARVANYKRAQLDQAGSTPEVLEQQLSEMNQQLSLARSDRVTVEARLTQIEATLADRGAVAVAEMQNDGYLATLRADRAELMRAESRLASRLGPDHPDRRMLAVEIAQIDDAVIAEVETIRRSLRNEIAVLGTREASLARDVDAIEAQLSGIATSSLRLRQLEREADAARALYEELLARLGETRAQVELQRAEAKLISAAQVPQVPSAPRPLLMTAFGGTLGLSLGLVGVLAFELFGAGFSRAGDLEAMSGLPVLSVIPRADIPEPGAVLAVLEDTRYSAVSERIRQLRTMLTLGAPAEGAQSILVLSSVANEGKTTTALALAHACAAQGSRVIVLDLDTRRALIDAGDPHGAARDLSEHLFGAAALDEVIQTRTGRGFDIAATRASRRLMLEGLPQARFAELIAALGRRYDAIVIDAPPVLAVSDGLSIAAVADSILYLVRYRSTSRKSVVHGLSTLRTAGIRPDGLVMTMTDPRSESDLYAAGYEYRLN